MQETGSNPRVAVVTGGLSGIGRATVRELLAGGVLVAAGARRGADADVAALFGDAEGTNVMAGALDVRDPASVAAFCGRVRAHWGRVDMLVNAAGVSVEQTVVGHDLSQWSAVIETNLTGPFLMAREVLPGMIAQGWGRIVNIGSTAARTAKADHPAYCASKAGLVALTRALALEGAAHGVNCVSVSPTWVETEMLQAYAADRAALNGTTPAQEIALIAAENPQGRLVQPEEVARVVAMLCSDQTPALTMEDIQINGAALW